MTFPSYILPLFAVTALTTAAVTRTVTTRKPLTPLSISKSDTCQDTLRGIEVDGIRLSGFDKPLRSRNETVFAINDTPFRVEGLIVRCDYRDLSGRQLHSRTVTVSCDIPPGETRQIRFRSWDSQGTFYYHRSERPRRATATAFDVTCTITAIIIPSKNRSEQIH